MTIDYDASGSDGKQFRFVIELPDVKKTPQGELAMEPVQLGFSLVWENNGELFAERWDGYKGRNGMERREPLVKFMKDALNSPTLNLVIHDESGRWVLQLVDSEVNTTNKPGSPVNPMATLRGRILERTRMTEGSCLQNAK